MYCLDNIMNSQLKAVARYELNMCQLIIIIG